MIVVTLTDCPPRLRGDLSKWLLEINTGVYVGQMNARVREKLWERICENLPKGRATMVYSANNEQRMEFRVHNTTWQPTDFEGLTLMRRPSEAAMPELPKSAKSNASINRTVQTSRAARAAKEKKTGYAVIDIETTGLDCENDEILEIGAIRVVDHLIAERFSVLVRTEKPIPTEITALTGLDTDMVSEQGVELKSALEQLWDFVGQSPLIGHNFAFDRMFLEKACRKTEVRMPRLPIWDTLTLARRELRDLTDYRLETLAACFGIKATGQHRALADCITTFRVYEKLNEI